MLGQGFDELVDFAFGVVDVGTSAEAAAVHGDDDAMLGLKVMRNRGQRCVCRRIHGGVWRWCF